MALKGRKNCKSSKQALKQYFSVLESGSFYAALALLEEEWAAANNENVPISPLNIYSLQPWCLKDPNAAKALFCTFVN